MLPTVLGHLTLGYQPVWNRLRQAVAVMLFIDQPDDIAVDAVHLLATLDQDTVNLQAQGPDGGMALQAAATLG